MIFYFSGTGNSLYIAQQIADNLNIDTVSITKAVKSNSYTFNLQENEMIGIVIPVYFCTIPYIVEKFVKNIKFENYNNNYCFVVLNCGSTTGDAAKTIYKLMNEKNYMINAEFALRMVDNYVLVYPMVSREKQELILQNANKTLHSIVTNIQKTKSGKFNNIKGFAPACMTLIGRLIYHKGKRIKFNISNECDGCGLCVETCPESAISLDKKHPIWINGKCTQCLSCLHRCPNNAIEYNHKSKQQYINKYVDFKRN